MTVQSMAYHGILNLEISLVGHVRDYLNEKERRLIRQVMALVSDSKENEEPLVSFQALPDFFLKKIEDKFESKQNPFSQEEGLNVLKGLTQIFWDYFEILEGCGSSLFQQIDQMPIDKWHERLFEVVKAIYEDLLKRNKDLVQLLQKIESGLKKNDFIFFTKKEKIKRFLFQFWGNQKGLIPKLQGHLEKNEKYLHFHYEAFQHSFSQFREVEKELNIKLAQLRQSVIFKGIDPDAKDKFEKLWYFLKLLEMNRSYPMTAPEKILREIQLRFNPEKVFWVFSTYFKSLYESLFQISRSMKLQIKDQEKQVDQAQLDFLKKVIHENHLLIAEVFQYREAILKSDPNPYIRSRLGIKEDVGEEASLLSQKFLSFSYEIEHLDELFHQLKKRLEVKFVQDENQLFLEKLDLAEEILHEMGHPLTSFRIMEFQAERLVTCLKSMNELTSQHPMICDQMGKILLHAIRLDWKYHVLFSLKGFWYVLEIHQGLIGKSDERLHFSRIGKLNQSLNFLKEWIQKQEIPQHIHQIEGLFEDLKEIIQDYYHASQRSLLATRQDALKQVAAKQEVIKQLFEIRALFGRFFAFIRKTGGDLSWICHQLLFVDQYLEAVERELNLS